MSVKSWRCYFISGFYHFTPRDAEAILLGTFWIDGWCILFEKCVLQIATLYFSWDYSVSTANYNFWNERSSPKLRRSFLGGVSLLFIVCSKLELYNYLSKYQYEILLSFDTETTPNRPFLSSFWRKISLYKKISAYDTEKQKIWYLLHWFFYIDTFSIANSPKTPLFM